MIFYFLSELKRDQTFPKGQIHLSVAIFRPKEIQLDFSEDF